MKLEALFTVNNNKLIKISDNSPYPIEKLKIFEIKWSQIELEAESYNEEYLAQLREDLKKLDDANEFALLVPQVDKSLSSPEDIELFINAYNHCARRIKDCVSVTGYALPAELLKGGLDPDSAARTFIDTVNIKHSQYVYFAKEEDVNNLNLKEKLQDSAIVIY